MSNQEVIKYYQRIGYGYKKAASLVGESPDSVKTYYRRNPVTETCLFCGKELVCNPKAKKKLFCSDKCRMTWWNKHRQLKKIKSPTLVVCAFCGTEFASYASDNRKYCSRSCVHQALRKEEQNEEK